MKKKQLPQSVDVVIVGARCAGASTALLLARQGARVLVVDRGRYGADTLSTHALMRGGVQQLAKWGLLSRLTRTDTPAIRTTSFHYGEDTIEVAIKPSGGVDALYAPRRTVLDALLVDAAREGGAQVEYGLHFTDFLFAESGRVEGVCLKDAGADEVRVKADLVIGADGMRSAVARRIGSEPYRLGRHAGGVVFAYWSGLDIEGYHWYYRPGMAAGAIPTTDGLTCVFAGVPGPRFLGEWVSDMASGYRKVIGACSPELAGQLEGAAMESRFRGFPGEPGFMRRAWGPGWALVGDSGYFRDPITAHGITDAFRDAELLSRAVANGTRQAFQEYQDTRDALADGLFEATDYIASFEWTLPQVQERHLFMSKEMGREARFLESLDGRAAEPRPWKAALFDEPKSRPPALKRPA